MFILKVLLKMILMRHGIYFLKDLKILLKIVQQNKLVFWFLLFRNLFIFERTYNDTVIHINNARRGRLALPSTESVILQIKLALSNDVSRERSSSISTFFKTSQRTVIVLIVYVMSIIHGHFSDMKQQSAMNSYYDSCVFQ